MWFERPNQVLETAVRREFLHLDKALQTSSMQDLVKLVSNLLPHGCLCVVRFVGRVKSLCTPKATSHKRSDEEACVELYNERGEKRWMLSVEECLCVCVWLVKGGTRIRV